MDVSVYNGLRKIAIGGDPWIYPLQQRGTTRHERRLKQAEQQELKAMGKVVGNNDDGSDKLGPDFYHALKLGNDQDFLYRNYPATAAQAALGIPFDMSRAKKESPDEFSRFMDNVERLYSSDDYMNARARYEATAKDLAIVDALKRHNAGSLDSDYMLGDGFETLYGAATDNDTSNDSAASEAVANIVKKHYGSWDNYKVSRDKKYAVNGARSPKYILDPDTIRRNWEKGYGRLAALRKLRDYKPLLEGYNFDVDGLLRDANSASWVQKNQNNHDVLLTDEGRKHLENSNRLLQNKNIAEWARTNPTLSDEMRKTFGLAEGADVKSLFDNNAGKAQWALKNFDSLRDMNQMRKSPFMWLLSALFSRDPSRLYRALGGMNKMFDSKNDGYYWDSFLGGQESFKGYKGWMPLLRMIHNLRYGISGGDGYNYLTE
jgi:hypothetical protein